MIGEGGASFVCMCGMVLVAVELHGLVFLCH